MNFTIAFGSYGNMPLDMWENSVVPYMVSHYISDPSYLRTTDGRPLLLEGSGNFVNDTVQQEALAFLRNYTRQTIGVDPVILYIAQDFQTHSDLTSGQSLLNLDGFFCFSFGPYGPGDDYPTRLSTIVPTLESQNISFNVPCTSSGADFRPWWGITQRGGVPPPSQMPYFANMSLFRFQTNLVQLRQYIDNNTSQTSRLLTVYAWNEWGEGGNIEPSRVNGYQYLDLIQRVFGLASRSSTPSVDPDAAVLGNLSVPSSLETGQPWTVNVTMVNRGTTTWRASGGYALGSLSPENNSIWGLDRANLTSSDSIAPGADQGVFVLHPRPIRARILPIPMENDEWELGLVR